MDVGGGDWRAVADVVNRRMDALAVRQGELAAEAGVSTAILREIQQGVIARRRGPRTLRAISTALGWHPEHLDAVLHGRVPPAAVPESAPAEDAVLVLLRTVVREIRGLRGQIGELTALVGERENGRR
ncbi:MULTISPECIES: hypothetical protein [Actinosynnema]|uniref:Uncharacterized protein n=1 Tax=Actinosynnema pretiosum TaxID=42197 RepID=A0A290Z1P7_9PSEU|nr:hypothetical protein [Actinosynnema pretiosum]ATE52956.1 hypothetical protein CNX65_06415 [Actinosynnema pretiosum]